MFVSKVMAAGLVNDSGAQATVAHLAVAVFAPRAQERLPEIENIAGNEVPRRRLDGHQLRCEESMKSAPAHNSLARRLWKELLELVYPPHCAVCDQLSQQVICPSCREQFEFIVPPYCPVCGQTAPPGLPEGQPCGKCRSSTWALDGARAVGPHRSTLREAVLVLKFRGRRQLLDPIAELLAQRLFEEARMPHPLPFDRLDAIVPVVLHPARRRWRGFDQAVLICRRLEQLTGIRCHETALVRVRNTKPQIGLTPAQRRSNMARAFQARHDALLRGGRFLLVDDVYTTGATLEAAAHALKKAGADKVYALTVTHAVPLWDVTPPLLGDEQDAEFL